MKSYNNHYIAITEHHELHLTADFTKQSLFKREVDSNGLVSYKVPDAEIYVGIDGEHVKAHNGQSKDTKFKEVENPHHKNQHDRSHHARNE